MKKQFIYLCLIGMLAFVGYQIHPCFAENASPPTDRMQLAAAQEGESEEDLLKDLNEVLKDYEAEKQDVDALAEGIPEDPTNLPDVDVPDTEEWEWDDDFDWEASAAVETEPEPEVVEERTTYVMPAGNEATAAKRAPKKKKSRKIVDGLIIDKQYEEIKALPKPEPFKQADTDLQVRDLLSPEEILEVLMTPEAREKKIDLDFDEAKLTNIIMTLGEAGDFNIVLDPKLKNLVIDFHLKDATLQDALILLSNAFDLGFARVGDSLFVTTKDKIRAENVTSSIVKLKNLKVDEAEQLVKGMVDKVNISQETNSLVLIGTPDDIIAVEKLLSKMDTPQPQVILEAKIIEINKDALKDLGVDWSDSLQFSIQEGTRLAEPTNTLNPSRDVFEVYKLDRTPVMFDVVIKMLEEENKAKVLSNPSITTLNNKEAEIFVGDRIPYAITTVASGVATTEVRYEEPGIRLTITPSIIEEGFVEIKIEPEVSYIFSFRGPDDQYPWVKKRAATAYVRVKNNQPFIIGGLLNQEDKKNLYKVPILGDIPLLGNLFKYEKETAVNNELIISVIPQVVGGAEE